MRHKVPAKIYAPLSMDEAGKLLRAGTIPRPFVQRMRLINAISATMIYKLDSDLLAPYDVIDLHHLLDVPISHGAIIEQLDSGGIRHALTTGDLTPLGDMAEENPALLEGLRTFWLHRFFMVPFDPLCIMLAMRAKLILDLVDELGHSYNLLRSLKWGWIDFGDIPDEYPGDPGDYYDPAFDNPILPPGGYTPPGTGEPGAWPAATDAEKAAYEAAPISDRRTLGNLAGTYGVSMSGQLVGGGDFGSHAFPPIDGDPCADKDDPAETVSIGYTTQGMQIEEEQELSVVGYHPRFAPGNYTWTIESGGGSLSTDTGYATTYTAPSENPDCALSPTIALWCGGEIVDTLEIAINGWTGDQAAVRICYPCDQYGTPTGEPCTYMHGNYTPNTGDCAEDYIGTCSGFLLIMEWKCDGRVHLECVASRQLSAGELQDGEGKYYLCYTADGMETACGMLFDSTEYCYQCSVTSKSFDYLLSLNPNDLRTSAMQTGGCCPEQLLL